MPQQKVIRRPGARSKSNPPSAASWQRGQQTCSDPSRARTTSQKKTLFGSGCVVGALPISGASLFDNGNVGSFDGFLFPIGTASENLK